MENGVNLPEYHLVLVFPQGRDAAVVNALFLIGHHLLKVDHVDVTQSFAVWTGSLRGVEREVVGCGVGVADASGGAHEPLGEVLNGARLLVEDHDQSLALFHGDGDGFLETVGGL